MENKVALQEFNKLHNEIVETCSLLVYPTDSTTRSLFGKTELLINKFYDSSVVNKNHFEKELNLIKRKTKGYNNYQKLDGLQKLVASVILEDLRIDEKFNTSTPVEVSSSSATYENNSKTSDSKFDQLIFWIKNHKFLSIIGVMIATLIYTGDAKDALVKLGILKGDTVSDLERQEFFSDNPPQFELWYSAFHPGNRDSKLRGTLLDDTTGITGSYRFVNKGRAIVRLEKISLPSAFRTRGYFTDRITELPYSLSPGDTIVVSCELPRKKRPIIETENELKKDVSIMCSYPGAEIRFLYKFHWRDGLFGKERVIIE